MKYREKVVGTSERQVLGRRERVKVTSQGVANAGVIPNAMQWQMLALDTKNEELLGFSEETVTRVLSEIRDALKVHNI